MDKDQLTFLEYEALKKARAVLQNKPREALRVLIGDTEEIDKGILALGLSSLLESSRQRLEFMHLIQAVTDYLKRDKVA